MGHFKNMTNKAKQLLVAYREAIPFLREIPDEMYFAIDPIGYCLPTGNVAKARGALEEQLGQYVMSYDKHVFKLDIPLQAHMCALLKGAVLNLEQQAILASYERRFSDQGITFVVYQKPLVLLDPQKSALAAWYKQKGVRFI